MKTLCRFAPWMLLSALVLFPRVAQSQAVQNIVLRNSFAPIGAGARGVGMGGAFIAVADDGTAATFNPAGLAQLRRAELAVVGFASSLSATTTGSSVSESDRSSANQNAFDFVGLAIPFDVSGKRLTFQLAYQRAVDLGGQGRAVVSDELSFQELGLGDPGRVGVSVEVVPEQRGAFHNVSAAAALQVTDRLSLGTALNYWIGEWTASGSRNVRLLQPGAGVARSTSSELMRIETDFEQAQSLRGFNLNLGFMLKYPKVSVGGSLRLPFSGDYRLDETNVSTLSEGSERTSPDDREIGITSQLRWPRSAGIGVALRPVNGLTITSDVSATMWSRASIEQLPDGALLTESAIDAQGNALQTYTDRNFFDLLPQALTKTSDSSQWRAGAEYLVTFSRFIVPVRAGYFHTTSPFTDARGEADHAIRGFTVGTGINFDRLVFDVAYEQRDSDVTLGLRRLTRGEPVDANPTESVSIGRFVASMILRFDDDGKVATFFRSLFAGPRSDSDDE